MVKAPDTLKTVALLFVSAHLGTLTRRYNLVQLVKRFTCILCAISLLTMSFPAFTHANSGGQPGQFMSWGAGARSLGMGKAYTAVSDEASASYWNPAAMTQIERKEITGLHAALFADTGFDFMGYVHPTRSAGIFGFSTTRLVSGGFEKIRVTISPNSSPDSPEFLKVEKIGEFANIQQATSLAYGKQLSEKLAIGASVKSISNQLDTYKQAFTAVDASFFAKNFFPHHRFGLVAQNVVSKISGDTADRLPLTFRIGNAYNLLQDRVVLALDLVQSRFSGTGWNFGAEYWILKSAAVRIGLEGRPGGISETTAGLGLKSNSLSIDVAIALHELGMSQRVSASIRFGRSMRSSRQHRAEKLVQDGRTAFTEGKYATAADKYEEALSVEPSNRELQAMVSKLHAIAGNIPAATGQGDIDSLVRQSLNAYVEGDTKTAYNAMRTAFERNPENLRFMEMANQFAKTANQPPVEMPRPGAVQAGRWTLVDQKLHDSLQAIYEGRYDISIAKCDEVLRIEPNNVLALGRMGAAFFLMGEKDKAITLWKRALELDPQNKVAIEYLKQLGEYR